jgi:hypothetical protein
MKSPWIVLSILLAASLPAISADSLHQGNIVLADRGMDFDVYIRLQEGMSEGELLQRAGPPDSQQVTSASQDGFTRTYYYFPTVSNPFTTTVTVSNGQITEIKRERKF